MILGCKARKWILVILWADALLSAGVLGYAFWAHGRQGRREDKGSGVCSVASAGKTSRTSSGAEGKQTVDRSASPEMAALDRQIASVRREVRGEMARQREAVGRFPPGSRPEYEEVALEDLESFSQEAYDEVLRRLAAKRQMSEQALERRRAMIAEMKPGILTEAEEREFLELLEFLNECDEAMVAGHPISDRSADYPDARREHLGQILRKYAQATCPPEALRLRKVMGEALSDGIYSFILPLDLLEESQNR